MNVTKVIFGVLELRLSLKFLSTIDLVYGWGILSRTTFLTIWTVLSFFLSVYLLGLIKFSHDDDKPVKLSVGRFLMATLVFFGTIYFISGVFGRPVNMLSGLAPPKEGGHNATNLCEQPMYSDYLHSPAGFSGYFDLDQAKRCAKEQGKQVLIDFTGHGCANFRKMEDNIWVDQGVKAEIDEKYIIVSLYIDDRIQLLKG